MKKAKKQTKKRIKKPANRSSRATVDARIERVAGMLFAGEWVTGDSHVALAAEWRVTVSAVEKYAAFASRIVNERLGGPNMARAWGLPFIQRNAMAAATEGNHKTAIEGAATFLKYSGAEAPQKVAITDAKGEDIPPYMQRVWPAEVWAWVASEAANGRAATEAQMSAYLESMAQK